MSDLYARLLDAESRIERQDNYQVSANLALHDRGGGYQNRGHGEASCPGSGRGGGDCGGQSTEDEDSKPPKCQLCGKLWHFVACCYKWLEKSFKPQQERSAGSATTTPSYRLDPEWITDSGVTDHITVELDKLTTREKYRGASK